MFSYLIGLVSGFVVGVVTTLLFCLGTIFFLGH
jgi:hypothetical protein